MSNRFSLDHLASLTIEGPDARGYAQSQFTVGIESLCAEHWTPLAWCDPKGRVISFMMAVAGENHVELILPASQLDSVHQRLQRFTIGRRAEVADAGPVSGTFEPEPGVPVLRPAPDRGMLVGESAPADPRSLRRWQRLDLCCGLPWLAPASSEQHLPQWLGLEELGGLAYDKGCYPGQEVIARLHYRGSVKYRLAGLRLDGAGAFEPNARLTDPEGAAVGHCLGGIDAEGVGLGVVSTRIDAGGQVLLEGSDHRHTARVTSPEGLC